MPICYRNARRLNGCGRFGPVVVRDRSGCGGARDTVAEELYNAAVNHVSTQRCCDSLYGCREIDTRRRCGYWPTFAHPRWLSCAELNSRRPCGRYYR